VAALTTAVGFPDRAERTEGGLPVVVVHHGRDEVALLVDRFEETDEVVVQSLPSRLAGLTQFVGTAARADGRPVLVVNVSAAVRHGRHAGSSVDLVRDPTPRRTVVLLAEDTMTTRALERSILESA